MEALFLMSEVPLYCATADEEGEETSDLVVVKGYLTHKKHPPPETLQ